MKENLIEKYHDRNGIEIEVYEDGSPKNISLSICRGKRRIFLGPIYDCHPFDWCVSPNICEFDGMMKALSGRRYKVARRWFLKRARELVLFGGVRVADLLTKGGDRIDWNKVK